VPYEVRSPGDLRRGMLGIWEPVIDPARFVATADLTAILTPALAYGQSDGSRIGRGAGFYDRLFARPEVKARRIGIAFDLQIVPHIPTEAHDARVNAIVTESGWIRF
jgi:5-formyltetrahydrofolate cyclo-ligase